MFDAILFFPPLPTIIFFLECVSYQNIGTWKHLTPQARNRSVPFDYFCASLLLLNIKSKYIKYTSE